MDKFPQMLFRAPGPEPMHGGMFATRIVADEAEMDAALADGWHESTPAAAEAAKLAEQVQTNTYADGTTATGPGPLPEQSPAEDNAQPTRAELEQKATELGLEFRSNISDAKLAERINAKLAEQGA